MRIVFMGTARLACDSLKALHLQPEFDLAAVVTQPDKPSGRDLKQLPSPVKATALGLNPNLPILQPIRARDPSFLTELARLEPDLIVVVAYGQILPSSILSLPRHGCVNVHTSLLPKYRGAAPIQFALLNNESSTGVTLMQMDAGMDTGNILSQVALPISSHDNAQTLHDRLAALGSTMLLKTLPELIQGRISPRPQNHSDATYTRKIVKDDGRIDWNQPAQVIWNQVRALTPWPGAFTTRPTAPAGSQLLKIWEATILDHPLGPAGTVLATDKNGIVVGCGTQSLSLQVLQLEGRRRLSVTEFLAGTSIGPGTSFLSGPPPDFAPRPPNPSAQ